MNEEINKRKDYDDFFKTDFTFALVIRGDAAQIQALKQYLVDHGVHVVFQKIHANKLFISEKDPNDKRGDEP